MKKYNGFLNTYPCIDLHGETKDTMIAPLNSFIEDCLKLKIDRIAIIHGIGQGILKNQTKEYLKHHKAVETYYIDLNNPGCTIVHLKL